MTTGQSNCHIPWSAGSSHHFPQDDSGNKLARMTCMVLSRDPWPKTWHWKWSFSSGWLEISSSAKWCKLWIISPFPTSWPLRGKLILGLPALQQRRSPRRRLSVGRITLAYFLPPRVLTFWWLWVVPTLDTCDLASHCLWPWWPCCRGVGGSPIQLTVVSSISHELYRFEMKGKLPICAMIHYMICLLHSYYDFLDVIIRDLSRVSSTAHYYYSNGFYNLFGQSWTSINS